MKLLICTQAVDTEDPILGFFHRWIEEFAKRCKKVTVICLKEGKHSLPSCVSVHSLGKEQGVTSRVIYIGRLLSFVWRFRKEYDAVFVHMNPEYILATGWLWVLLGKRVVLWYAHKVTSLRLRVAAMLTDAMVTPAKESIRISHRAVHVVGHGIDTAAFTAHPIPPVHTVAPRIVSVGRITPIKKIDTLITAVALLKNEGMSVKADIIGSPAVPSDIAYEKKLHTLVTALGVGDVVSFLGSRTNAAMPEVYAGYDVSVNLCPTGGVDKVVIESMAAGLPVLTSNEAFRPCFGRYADRLLFAYDKPADLVLKLKKLLKDPDLQKIQSDLRQAACTDASVENVVSGIMGVLHGASS